MSAVILWAGKVLDSNGGNPQFGLGPPDGRTNTLGTQFMTLGDFRGGFYPSLRPLLNGSKGGDAVTARMLARTDVIAFELNGGHGAGNRGWESSRWEFSDGNGHSLSVDWDETTTTSPASYPPQVIANGSTDRANYVSFFGFDWPAQHKDQVISYILFDLPRELDVSSRGFRIKVSGWADGRHGEGTPDPDAIGIFPCNALKRTRRRANPV